MPDRRRFSELLDVLLELAPEVRVAYLDEHCFDDPELRAEVERVLENEAGADEVLRAIDSGTELCGSSLSPGSRDGHDLPSEIGPYRIVETLGEGGMGVVYLADQEKPVRRRVALKLIRLGMSTTEMLARFDAERQALAMMDHPSIANVFDAGATESGRSYFVMEYVPGEPITSYCDRHQLTIRERLKLFVRVCRGVQHAHQKAVIHRDIKPSNILVTAQDNEHLPKIIDFGIAKAIEHRLTECATLTEKGQIVGTLDYMSPEQADPTVSDVDTRSDIYSLGVVLFQLLVGAMPFDTRSLHARGYEEILRAIREGATPKPSTRLSSADVEVSVVAQNRRSEPRSLSKQLRGDLDWIALKALEKDRTRRYSSAAELAADVERHLAHEPVLAGPPSTLYRLGKAFRRHRIAISAGAAVFVAIAVGLVVSLVAVGHARVESARAERNFGRARGVIERMVGWVGQEELKDIPQMEDVRRKLLEDALEFQLAFIEDEPLSPVLRADTARAYSRLGEIYALLARNDDALLAYQEALRFAEMAPEDARERPEHQRFIAAVESRLAILFDTLGRRDESEDLRIRSLETYRRIAQETQSKEDLEKVASAQVNVALILQSKRPREALELIGESTRTLSELLERFSDDVKLRFVLVKSLTNEAGLRWQLGETDESDRIYRRAQGHLDAAPEEVRETVEWRETTAFLASARGNLLEVLGRLDDAASEYRQSSDFRKNLVEDFPNVPSHRNAYAATLSNLGRVLDQRGMREEAEEAYEDAIDAQEALARDYPDVLDHRVTLGRSHLNLARVLVYTRVESGELGDAERASKRAVDLFEDVTKELPGDPRFALDLATSYGNLATVFRYSNRLDEALEVYGKSLAIYEEFVAEKSDLPDYKSEYAGNLHNIAEVLLEKGDLRGAKARLVEAIRVQDAALRLLPANPQFLLYARNHHYVLGRVALALGDHAEALRVGSKLTHYMPDHSETCEWQGDLFLDCVPVAFADSTLSAEGRSDAVRRYRDLAQRAYSEGRMLVDKRLEDSPQDRGLLAEKAYFHGRIGTVFAKESKYDEAIPEFELAVASQRKALPNNGRIPPQLRATLVQLYSGLIDCSIRTGNHTSAARHIDELAEFFSGRWEEAYNAACLFARCIPAAREDETLSPPQREVAAEEYANRALKFLRRSASEGFDQVEHMTQDPDLASLRGRDEYEAILTELRKGSEAR